MFQFRTCIYHPKKLAVCWSGHVHIYTPIGKKMVTVGRCRACNNWEHKQEEINGYSVSGEEFCPGCYGKWDKGLR